LPFIIVFKIREPSFPLCLTTTKPGRSICFYVFTRSRKFITIGARFRHVAEEYVKARIDFATRNGCRVATAVQHSKEILHVDVVNEHLARAAVASIVAVILRDEQRSKSVSHIDVVEGDVGNVAPATTPRLVVVFVAGLWCKLANPGFDIYSVSGLRNLFISSVSSATSRVLSAYID
jgi:hypothetical protein